MYSKKGECVMETLGILENKIAALLDFANRLKVENEHLVKSLELANKEHAALQAECATLAEINKNQNDDIGSLKSALAAFENSVLASKTSIDEFQQEKVLTKILVDDLISSIDSLVEHDSQL
jgi:chromosome segregation ATPase